MTAAMRLRLARASDVPGLLELREDAAMWLAARGSDQWREAWPDEAGMVARIAAAVAQRETWCVEEDGAVVATVTVSREGAPALWSAAELAEPALYVHRLIVARGLGGRGVGAELLDWAGTRAALSGGRWIRVDVWTSNTHLHTYYRERGFTLLRIVQSDYPSGALLQRRARWVRAPRLCACLAGAAAGEVTVSREG